MIIVLLGMYKLQIDMVLYLYIKFKWKKEVGSICFPHPRNNKQWPMSGEYVYG